MEKVLDSVCETPETSPMKSEEPTPQREVREYLGKRETRDPNEVGASVVAYKGKGDDIVGVRSSLRLIKKTVQGRKKHQGKRRTQQRLNIETRSALEQLFPSMDADAIQRRLEEQLS